MPKEHQRENRIPRKRYVQLTLLVWVAMIGVDFFLHGGIFAATYVEDSPFLLSAMEAFLRIPAGYLALLASSLRSLPTSQRSSKGFSRSSRASSAERGTCEAGSRGWVSNR